MRRGNGKTDVNIDLRDQGLRDDLRGVDSEHELPAADGRDESPQGTVASKAAEAVSGSEVEKLKTERDALLDRLARLQAEFDNARNACGARAAGIPRVRGGGCHQELSAGPGQL